MEDATNLELRLEKQLAHLSDEDKANEIMTLIVHRALGFNSSYKAVMVELDSTVNGLVAWHFLNILNIYRDLPVFLKGIRQPKFVNKRHYAVEKVWNPFRWKRLQKQGNILEFDFSNAGKGKELKLHWAEPFAEIGQKNIELIARALYEWED